MHAQRKLDKSVGTYEVTKRDKLLDRMINN